MNRDNEGMNASFDPKNPVEPIGTPSLLDVEQLVTDLVGNGTDLQFGIHWDVVVHSLVFDILHCAHDHCSTSSKAFQHLSFLLPLDHLVNRYLPL